MAAELSEALVAALSKGSLQVGQVRIEADPGGGFRLFHFEDSSAGLEAHSTPEAALEIARFDSEKEFRPLKTAPNLRRGWVLQLRDIPAIGEALNYFYPGRLPVLLAAGAKRLISTPLRSTLNRQTGMYRAATNISDEQIDDAVFVVCRSDGGCLRTILWKRDEAGAIPSQRLPPDKFDPSKNQARRTGGGRRRIPAIALPGSVHCFDRSLSQEGASCDARATIIPMIIRGRLLVTMDGPPLENGAVAVEGDRIAGVGSFTEVRAAHSGEVLDLGERVLLPGLINAHCHLDYTCLRGKIPPQKSFTEWIKAINAAKATLTPDDYVRSINDGFGEARRFGTTSMVNLTAFPELIALVRPAIRTHWAAELIDIRAPEKAPELLERALSHLKMAESSALAPHAPYTASPNLYRLCQQRGFLLTTHLAESREEMQMFRDGEGELFDFIRAINPALAVPRQTPLSYFLSELDQGSHWLVAHMNELDESDFALLETRKPSLGIVHCPRSHAFFRHSAFPFQRLRELDFPICLGTDSLASNSDLSLFAEMRAFQSAFPAVKPEEILRMVTIEPGLAGVGKLRADFHADIIAITNTASSESIFEEIIHTTDEPWVMTGGQAGTI